MEEKTEKIQDKAQEMRDEVQDKQDKKRGRGNTLVTRRDFYGCVMILLIAVFLQGMQTRALIRRNMQNLEDRYQSWDRQLQNSISNIQNSIASSLEEADNPLRESSVEIVAADLKAKKATLRMTAVPKEWKTGDTSLQFYLSCDGGEKIAIAASAGADHVFTAEQEIPFCEAAAVSATLQRGDMEYPSDLGETNVSGAVYPFFSGDFLGSYTWQNGAKDATVAGDITVEVQPSDWMMQKGKTLTLKNPTIAIYLDGKQIQRHKMEAESDDPYLTRYTYTIEKAFQAESGQTIEVFFRAEDENGLKYTYLVDRTHVEKGDIRTEEMAVEAVSAAQDGRLTVE